MDLASIMQVQNGLAIVERLLHQTAASLESMCVTYRDTPMAGRTHLQHALPITFGYKCGVWLSGILRHVQRLEQLKDRCLLVQFGGAAGTLASLGNTDSGIRVRKRMAAILNLRDPVITWHVSRDTIAEVVGFLAMVGGSLGKIALDLIIMSSNELNEVSIQQKHYYRLLYGIYLTLTFFRSRSHMFPTEAHRLLCPKNETQSPVKSS